jgi:FAD dependent oxidoreductase
MTQRIDDRRDPAPPRGERARLRRLVARDMETLPPGERRGWWLREALDADPGEPCPPPSRDATADVVIIGGGYTGLWTAWWLTEHAPDARVVILEADIVRRLRLPFDVSGDPHSPRQGAQDGPVQTGRPTQRPEGVNARRLLPLMACALLLACGSAGTSLVSSPSPVISPAGGPPKVTGTISAGPVCPVEQSPPDPQCAPRPVAGAVVVVTDASGQEVGRATSALDGSYQLFVTETGTVLITALPVAGLARPPAPVSVTLAFPSATERLDLQYDTGIR